MRSCMAALASFSPMMLTVLPRPAYLAVIASSAAIVETSQRWDSFMSITTFAGSSAYSNCV